ncbi:MAG: L,D-transpeptidase family protein [Acidobacteriota bacterium]
MDRMRCVVLLLAVCSLWFCIPCGLAAPSDELRLEIHKTDRNLRLWRGEKLVARVPIGLGFEPRADKLREGDGATPEGRFEVCIKNPQSQYYLSLGLTYPNAEDAARGLRTGLIDEADHRRILAALERGHCPPWDTALGGEIFIHGRGAGSDWTLGCVALDDADMKRLFDLVPVGTAVEIKP